MYERLLAMDLTLVMDQNFRCTKNIIVEILNDLKLQESNIYKLHWKTYNVFYVVSNNANVNATNIILLCLLLKLTSSYLVRTVFISVLDVTKNDSRINTCRI